MDMNKQAWVSALQTTTATAIWIFSRPTSPMTHAISITTMATGPSATFRLILESGSTTTMSRGGAVLLITTTMAGLTSFKSTDTFIQKSITITSAKRSKIQDWSIRTWAMATSKMSPQKWAQASMPDSQAGEQHSEITTTTAEWTS